MVKPSKTGIGDGKQDWERWRETTWWTNEGWHQNRLFRGCTVCSPNLGSQGNEEITRGRPLRPHAHSWPYNYHMDYKLSHGSPLPSRNPVAFKSWPWPLLGFPFPIPSPYSSRQAPDSGSMWRLLSPGRAGALSLVCITSLSPHFLPVVSSFTAQLFWSLAGFPQTDILVASFFAPAAAPRVVFTSLLEHVSCLLWMTGFVYLSLLPHSPALRRRVCLILSHIPQHPTPCQIQSRFSTNIGR